METEAWGSITALLKKTDSALAPVAGLAWEGPEPGRGALGGRSRGVAVAWPWCGRGVCRDRLRGCGLRGRGLKTRRASESHHRVPAPAWLTGHSSEEAGRAGRGPDEGPPDWVLFCSLEEAVTTACEGDRLAPATLPRRATLELGAPLAGAPDTVTKEAGPSAGTRAGEMRLWDAAAAGCEVPSLPWAWGAAICRAGRCIRQMDCRLRDSFLETSAGPIVRVGQRAASGSGGAVCRRTGPGGPQPRLCGASASGHRPHPVSGRHGVGRSAGLRIVR